MQHDRLPLFPLPLVLLPRTYLPLHIFEDRYREMIGEALARASEFGIVQTAEGGVLRTGCTASIEKVLKRYDDGRLDILTFGRRRFEVESVNTDRDFLQGDVRFFDDDSTVDSDPRDRRRALTAFSSLTGEIDADLKDRQLSFQLAQASNDLDFRQTLLGLRSEAERMKLVAHHLETALKEKVHSDTAKKIAGQNGHGHTPLKLP